MRIEVIQRVRYFNNISRVLTETVGAKSLKRVVIFAIFALILIAAFSLLALDGLKTDPLLGTTNVLIVGLDGPRSDALALAVIDRRSRSVRILSIPRDSRVSIPGRQRQDKINHVYAFGGLDLTKRTVMELFNITVNYSIVLDFASFPKIIDLIGGIDIYVERRMVYRDRSQGLFINISQGRQHMDGETALHYVRFRSDPMADIGRIRRQQRFMSAVAEKLRSPSVIPRIPSLVGEVVLAVRTDISPREALQMLRFLNSLEQDNIKMMTLPGTPARIGGINYWVIDVTAGADFIAGET